MKKVISLVLCFAVPCFAQEADGGTLLVEVDAGVPFVGPEFPRDAPLTQQVVVLDSQQAAAVRMRILACEAERDEFRKTPLVTPWAVVAIAAGSALLAGVAVVGFYELGKPK